MKKLILLAGTIICVTFLNSLIISKSLLDTAVTSKQFFVFFAFIILSLLVFAYYVKVKEKIIIKLNIIDVLVAGYFFYIIARAIFTPAFSFSNIDSIAHFISILMYFFTRSVIFEALNKGLQFNVILKALAITFILIITIQSGYGLLQALEIKESLNKNFLLSGFFYNPGPFGIYIALFIPYIIGLIIYNSNKIFKCA